MLIYITTRLISATAAFLYPGYASYKTLSQRPASEEELERWLMYWSVLGCIVAAEYVAEWVISWIPFYYTLKMLFLLYLALPQTRGASYLYKVHLQPFFETHEADIDRAVVQIKDRAYAFVQDRLRLLWAYIMAALGQAADPSAAGAAQGVPPPPGTGGAAQPSLGDPVSGPAALLGGFWRSYGPTIVASGASLFQRAAAQAAQTPGAAGPLFNLAAGAAAAGGQRSPNQPPLNRQTSHESVEERRRRLQSELASLGNVPSGPPSPPSPSSSGSDNAPQFPTPIPHQWGSTGYSNLPPSASEADLRARVGQFEEIEVPSDVEGYDVGEPPRRPGAGGAGDAGRRTSWFGWGGQGDTAERAKRE